VKYDELIQDKDFNRTQPRPHTSRLSHHVLPLLSRPGREHSYTAPLTCGPHALQLCQADCTEHYSILK